MGNNEASVRFHPGERRRLLSEFRPEHTHPAPVELTAGCSAAHILRSVCALGSSLPVLEDLVKGDIDLLLF